MATKKAAQPKTPDQQPDEQTDRAVGEQVDEQVDTGPRWANFTHQQAYERRLAEEAAEREAAETDR